jgi:hypothetical protein
MTEGSWWTNAASQSKADDEANSEYRPNLAPSPKPEPIHDRSNLVNDIHEHETQTLATSHQSIFWGGEQATHHTG